MSNALFVACRVCLRRHSIHETRNLTAYFTDLLNDCCSQASRPGACRKGNKVAPGGSELASVCVRSCPGRCRLSPFGDRVVGQSNQ